MPIAAALLPEFDMEMANTRRCLERVPDEKLDWKAHPKSWSLREISTHLANLPKWTVLTIAEPSFDVAPAGEAVASEKPITSIAHAVEMFDANVAAARAAIAGASDGELMETWSFLKAGEVAFSMPRVSVLRGFIMNHMIHHRGQLGVYLRLNDVAVPSLYGPSADEG